MSYLEELLPEFRKGAKIRIKDWDSNRYIYFCNGVVFSAEDHIVIFPCEYIDSNKWELYREPINWQYIIDNKCLCWFWDDAGEKFNNIGFLKAENSDRFLSSDSFEYAHCRPVRKDEVTFYEEKKDEL